MGENKRRKEYYSQKPEDRLGDAPVEAEYYNKMTAIMETLDHFLNAGKRPREIGLVVMVFPFGDHEGRCNYMSNGADRRDIVTLMKEMIARFEGQPEVSGRA